MSRQHTNICYALWPHLCSSASLLLFSQLFPSLALFIAKMIQQTAACLVNGQRVHSACVNIEWIIYLKYFNSIAKTMNEKCTWIQCIHARCQHTHTHNGKSGAKKWKAHGDWRRPAENDWMSTESRRQWMELNECKKLLLSLALQPARAMLAVKCSLPVGTKPSPQPSRTCIIVLCTIVTISPPVAPPATAIIDRRRRTCLNIVNYH